MCKWMWQKWGKYRIVHSHPPPQIFNDNSVVVVVVTVVEKSIEKQRYGQSSSLTYIVILQTGLHKQTHVSHIGPITFSKHVDLAGNRELNSPACIWNIRLFFFFCFILLTHKGSHREAYRDFQPSLTSFAAGAKGCSDHSGLRATPSLHCPIANSTSTQCQQPV